MTSNKLSDIIPPVESILCPHCGNNVTIAPHPNSHGIAGMGDCLYHAQCKKIACQNCAKEGIPSLYCMSVNV